VGGEDKREDTEEDDEEEEGEERDLIVDCNCLGGDTKLGRREDTAGEEEFFLLSLEDALNTLLFGAFA
jgi:hypothetical protein